MHCCSEWFTDSYVNTCYNALDRHVAKGRADQTAIIYDSPITGTKQDISYRDLLAQTAQMAGTLSANGISKGDRVIIYMPMIPETIVAMLACARIGATHSVVFSEFAANELAVHIDDASPKAILSASRGIEPDRVIAYKPLIDAAINLATHKPEFVVIHQRKQLSTGLKEGRDFDWRAFQEDAKPAPCVPVEGNHRAYILYTTGTTGAPEGVIRPTVGHRLVLQWSMKNIYNVDPDRKYKKK